MDRRERRDPMSEDVEGREETGGMGGTERSRARTAGTYGAGVPRRDRSRGAAREAPDVAAEELSEAAQDTSARLREEEREAEEERNRRITGELVEFELAGEGEAGEGRERSGTLPDSFGGTTGTSGHAAGEQAPGSDVPSIRGIDPEEARKRIGRRRRGRR